MGSEATFNWGEIVSEDWTFDSNLQKIAAIERVTKERLMACFNEIFFQNPRRINLKVHSHAHRDDTDARATSIALNDAYYLR